MVHVITFLFLVSVVILAWAGEDGVHELAKRRASKYELVIVTQLEGNRPIKSISTHTGSNIHIRRSTFHLKIGNHDNIDKNVTEWIVDLDLNLDLLSSNFQFFSIDPKTSVSESTNSYEHCYYHGNIRGVSESSVSLSTCGGGLEGFIFDGRDLYHLETFGEEGEHFMYHSEDILGEDGVCGVEGNSPISHGDDFGQKILRQRRAQANKFVEFFLVLDRTHFQLTGSNITFSKQYAIEIANHMDFIYRAIGVRIALVGAEVWTTTEFIQTTSDLDILLDNWIRYLPTLKIRKAEAGIHFDNAHIVTGLSSSSNVIGKAPLNSMCFSSSGGVNRDTTGSLATRVATTLCHEMGHNFGMEHDDGRECNDCPDVNRGCIMNALLRNPSPTQFSSCSSQDLHTALNRGVGSCIYNSPPRLFTDPICGNAFVEDGEECDCGSVTECPVIDPCCEPGECKLYPWAECGSGDCCNNCSYTQQGVVCREVTGSCDLTEKCTGNTNMCPDNLFRRNGLPCSSGGADSFCYEGACSTLLDQCHYVWGPDASVADDICFERVNLIGDQYGNCGVNELGSYLPCEPSNVKCGKLHCDVARDATPILLGSYTITYFQYPNAFCTAVSISSGDMIDPGYVPDGTLCGDSSICLMGVCTNVSDIPYIPCPVGFNGQECAGESECSNTGVCVIPTDAIIHSTSGSVIAVSIIVVVIVVIAFVVSGILIGFWLYSKRDVKSKPATSIGRTRGASFTEIVATKLGSLPRYANLPSYKNSVNSSQQAPPPNPATRPPPRAPPPKQPPPRIQKK